MTFFQQLLLAYLEPIPFSLSLTFGRTKPELQRNFIQLSLAVTLENKIKEGKTKQSPNIYLPHCSHSSTTSFLLF